MSASKINILFLLFFSITIHLLANENFEVDWTNGKVYSSITVSVPLSYDFAQKRLIALERAKAKAIVNYYRALNNIRMSDKGDSLYQYFNSIGEHKSSLFSMLNEAELFRLEYPNETTISVTYFINIFGKENSLLDIIMGSTKHYIEELSPYMGYNYESDYTGIIIDARGELTSFEGEKISQAKPSVFLTIRDSEGAIVFNRYNVLSEVIRHKGMVRYTNDVYEDVSERVGKNPLKVVAYGVGDKFGSVIVVSMKDARLMLSSQATRNAIKEGKISVIMDKN